MEDLIRRSDAVAILEDLQKDHLQFCLIPFRQAIERVQAIPSAESTGDLDNAIYEYVKEGLMDNPYGRPQGDTVSRRYLLAEIDDLADEFSEVDENGLHSERWCGIVDAKLIIMNAPSVSDRPQGEWIDAEIPIECGGSMPIQVCNLCKTFYPLAYTGGGHRFCPNCGADMREREGE